MPETESMRQERQGFDPWSVSAELEEDWEYDPNDYQYCNCRFCHCHAVTLDGLACDDCLAGVHQG